MTRPLILLFAFLLPSPASAAQAHVAVASNFAAPMQALATQFEAATGHRLILSFGATGKFYAQIKHGAPFDVLLAADDETPARLRRDGDAVRTQTYAIGRLVLWSPEPGRVDGSDSALRRGQFERLAIANPKLAPYGAAAIEVLDALKLTQAVRQKFVIGENIAQTYQFVASGNAELGFVALAQVMQGGEIRSGSYWIVPSSYHTPIRQDAALLKRGATNPAARALLDYLRTPAAALTLMRGFGYER